MTRREEETFFHTELSKHAAEEKERRIVAQKNPNLKRIIMETKMITIA